MRRTRRRGSTSPPMLIFHGTVHVLRLLIGGAQIMLMLGSSALAVFNIWVMWAMAHRWRYAWHSNLALQLLWLPYDTVTRQYGLLALGTVLTCVSIKACLHRGGPEADIAARGRPRHRRPRRRGRIRQWRVLTASEDADLAAAKPATLTDRWELPAGSGMDLTIRLGPGSRAAYATTPPGEPAGLRLLSRGRVRASFRACPRWRPHDRLGSAEAPWRCPPLGRQGTLRLTDSRGRAYFQAG